CLVWKLNLPLLHLSLICQQNYRGSAGANVSPVILSKALIERVVISVGLESAKVISGKPPRGNVIL
ncbi:hypothetical protein LIZ10_26100, partial [Escherichia coli]|uniref:hypothetical protein n=1 Tax=Escherichia coli TaxID=562 RepID=UPI001D05C30D